MGKEASSEIETYFGKCKCCLKYGYLRTMWEKHFVDGVNEIYGQMLTQCFSISWTIQNSESDDQICEECVSKLRDAITFKKQVIRSQQALAGDGGVEFESNDNELKQESANYYVEYLDEELLDKKEQSFNEGEINTEESLNEGDSDGDDRFDDNFNVNDEDTQPNDGDSDENPDNSNSPGPRKRSKPKQTNDSDDEPKPKWPKKLPLIERYKTYNHYTEQDLKKAVDAVMAKRMNQKEAAKAYHVPRQTLASKVRAVRDGVCTDEDIDEPSEKANDDSDGATEGKDDPTEKGDDPIETKDDPTEKGDDPIETKDDPTEKEDDLKEKKDDHTCATVKKDDPGNESLNKDASDDDRDDPTEESQDDDAVVIIKKHRDNVHSVLAYSNATPIRGYWGKGFVCAFCADQFCHPAHLRTHTKTHGNIAELYQVKHVRAYIARLDVTSLKCKICNTKMEDLESLMTHLKNDHDKPVHFDIDNHMIPFKFNTKEFKCVKCDEVFNNFKHICEHMCNVHIRNYVCTVCQRGFVNKSHLLCHNDTHRTGMFPCRHCKHIFSTLRKRTTHERYNHKVVIGPYKCSFCKKQFPSSDQRDEHEDRTHRKLVMDYNCNECDKSYVSRRSLRAHVLNAHLKQRSYKCPERGCGKSFFNNKVLKDHIMTHLGATFFCPECPKVYKTPKSLRAHMYIHTDKKGFKCLLCNKAFVLKENLELHMQKKHFVKPVDDSKKA